MSEMNKLNIIILLFAQSENASENFDVFNSEEFDGKFSPSLDTDEDIANLAADLLPALDVYHAAQRLFLIFNTEKDKIRFERLCRYIVASLQSDSVKLSYVGVFLMKEHRYVIRKNYIIIFVRCL